MQGTLDKPPIIIRPSSLLLAIYISIYAVVLLIVTLILLAGNLFGPHPPIWMYFYGAFWALGIWLFSRRLNGNDALTLAPDGLTVSVLGKKTIYKWQDVSRFEPWQSSLTTKQIGIAFTPAHAKHGMIYDISRSIYQLDTFIIGGWELNAVKLCNLLNQARADWANEPAPIPNYRDH